MSMEDSLFHTQRPQLSRKDTLNSIANVQNTFPLFQRFSMRHSRMEWLKHTSQHHCYMTHPQHPKHRENLPAMQPIFQSTFLKLLLLLPSPNLAQLFQCYPRSTNNSHSICFWKANVRHVINQGFYSSPRNPSLDLDFVDIFLSSRTGQQVNMSQLSF